MASDLGAKIWEGLAYLPQHLQVLQADVYSQPRSLLLSVINRFTQLKELELSFEWVEAGRVLQLTGNFVLPQLAHLCITTGRIDPPKESVIAPDLDLVQVNPSCQVNVEGLWISSIAKHDSCSLHPISPIRKLTKLDGTRRYFAHLLLRSRRPSLRPTV